VKLLGLGAAFGVAGIIVAALAGKDILKLFYTPEYAEYSGVFLLLMGAAGISYVASFVGFAMIAARRIRTQIPLFGCVILVTTVTCLVFAPSLGLLGIAVGVTAGVLFQLVAGVSVILYALAAMTREEVLG
jgi:O-antigen/teichoic acid export membrane protein